MILHLAFALELEAAKERAQWRNPIFNTKWGATKFPPLKGAEAAKSARTADQCNISRRQKFPHTGKQEHASLIRAINMWHKFDVFMPTREGAPSRTAAHSRLAPTWKTVDRRKHAKSRLVAKGYEDPDFGGGSGGNLWLREFAIFESTRRVGALDCGYRKCLFAGGYLSARRVTSRAPRMMLLSAFIKNPYGYLSCKKDPLKLAGLKFQASFFGRCLYCIHQAQSGAAVVIAAQTDDILGCGEPGVFLLFRRFLACRLRTLEILETNFANVWTKLPPGQGLPCDCDPEAFYGKAPTDADPPTDAGPSPTPPIDGGHPQLAMQVGRTLRGRVQIFATRYLRSDISDRRDQIFAPGLPSWQPRSTPF